MSIDRSMDKEYVINVHNGLLFRQKKEGNPASGNNMDDTRGYYAK